MLWVEGITGRQAQIHHLHRPLRGAAQPHPAPGQSHQLRNQLRQGPPARPWGRQAGAGRGPQQPGYPGQAGPPGAL
jgi:hypothetical protein